MATIVNDPSGVHFLMCGCPACLAAAAQAGLFAGAPIQSLTGTDGTLSLSGVVPTTPSGAVSAADVGAGTSPISGGVGDPLPGDPQPSGAPNAPGWTAGQAAAEAALAGFQSPIGSLTLSPPGNSAIGYSFVPNPDGVGAVNGALTTAEGSNFYGVQINAGVTYNFFLSSFAGAFGQPQLNIYDQNGFLQQVVRATDG